MMNLRRLDVSKNKNTVSSGINVADTALTVLERVLVEAKFEEPVNKNIILGLISKARDGLDLAQREATDIGQALAKMLERI